MLIITRAIYLVHVKATVKTMKNYDILCAGNKCLMNKFNMPTKY